MPIDVPSASGVDSAIRKTCNLVVIVPDQETFVSDSAFAPDRPLPQAVFKLGASILSVANIGELF